MSETGLWTGPTAVVVLPRRPTPRPSWRERARVVAAIPLVALAVVFAIPAVLLLSLSRRVAGKGLR
jgi:hypothetical protein